ncbi:molybdopterin molybdotransferase MoeA [Rhodococcus sp. OK302]|uniref:molybdopterin molybdotransferase MoeA n=1 Tax=Rhodococcus sp. OK302 TaxID=1882769 RepID=UPI000B93E817|nr:gephyrin-like molybdotransferase Glp [Rhodococcus sp. OK302]
MSARSVEDHRAHVSGLLAALHTLAPTELPVVESLGSIVATDINSPVDLPLFRNSQMDGYAVDAQSVRTVPVTLTVRGVLAAGSGKPPKHLAGSAFRIMTGAPIPEGADAVIPVEDTTNHSEHTVTIERGRTAGEYVRERGSDITAGMLLVRSGTRLEPRHIAALAAVGAATVTVYTPPRVAIITTGAELKSAGTQLEPGEIYDSNGPALATLARANGADVVSVARSTDDPDMFRELLSYATSVADLVFTSGGVSMGDFEVVKETLGPLGAQFGHVAMQPGGPQGTAVVNEVPILSFPGNPVSTMISFEVFARGDIRHAAGLPSIAPQRHALTTPLRSIPGKRQFLRARRTNDGVELVSGAGSHLVAAMAWADALLDIAADVTELDAGTLVDVIPLSTWY